MWYSRYIWFLAIALVASGSAFWLLVSSRLDPCLAPGSREICDVISPLALSLFFISLFFFLVSFFSLLGFLFRIWTHRTEVYVDHVTISLRQGVLLTIASIGCLALLLLNLLTWWSGFLFVLIVVLIELYFTAKA